MAYRLVEAGVNLVQVNLGKNSTWDTHRRNFVNLKDNLLPLLRPLGLGPARRPARRAACCDDTLVIVTGEFGRTPKINKDAGRDHWGPVMTPALRRRRRPGRHGHRRHRPASAAYPIADRQTPENLAATHLPRARHPARDDLARHRRPAVRAVPRRADPGADRQGVTRPRRAPGRERRAGAMTRNRPTWPHPPTTLVVVTLLGFPLPCLAQQRAAPPAGREVLAMTPEQASAFARLALKGIQKEYPNKPADVLNGAADVKPPRALHPGFYGCFDWHSSVHGHWMLVRLLRLFPDLPEKQADPRRPGGAPDREEPPGRGRLLRPARTRSRSSGPTAGPGC